MSEATRSDLVRLGVAPAARIGLRPPGIELGPLLALPEVRPAGELRRELSIPPGAPIVAVIGRLAPVKRPALAVEVFARAEEIERSGAHLVVAGDGPERRAVERAVSRVDAGLAERVHLLGAVARIERVHEAADVLLATSRSEGMPVAMIEAAAAARPVVTTAVGGVPELVISGLTGLFGTDRDALAVALAGSSADPEERARLGRAARRRASELHGAEALADGLEGAYRRLASLTRVNLLMVSGDRQVAVGERGPFWSMLRHFSTFFERVDVLVPSQPGEVTTRRVHDNVHLHPATVKRAGMAPWIDRFGGELVGEHGHGLVVTHD